MRAPDFDRRSLARWADDGGAPSNPRGRPKISGDAATHRAAALQRKREALRDLRLAAGRTIVWKRNPDGKLVETWK